jgi:hypothetical protein
MNKKPRRMGRASHSHNLNLNHPNAEPTANTLGNHEGHPSRLNHVSPLCWTSGLSSTTWDHSRDASEEHHLPGKPLEERKSGDDVI